MNKSAAEVEFANEIAKLQSARPGMSFSNAWNRTAVLRPELMRTIAAETKEKRRLAGIKKGLPQFLNTIPPAPVFSVVPHSHFAPLGLSSGVKPEIFAVAWTANLGQLAARDTSAIVDAITKYLMQHEGCTPRTALNYIAEKFPVLFAGLQKPNLDFSRLK